MSILFDGVYVNSTQSLWEPNDAGGVPAVVDAKKQEGNINPNNLFIRAAPLITTPRRKGWYVVNATVNIDPKSADSKTFTFRLSDTSAAASIGQFTPGGVLPSFTTTSNGYGKWWSTSWLYYVPTEDVTQNINFEIAVQTSSITGGVPTADANITVMFIKG
jgi:hypothetical protein